MDFRTGPFRDGDKVQLTDPKGKHYTFALVAGKQFHTHKGAIEHDELIGGPEGVVVTSTQRSALPGAASTFERLRLVDATRRHGRLSKGRRADRSIRRHLPRCSRRRGRRRIWRTHLFATAGGWRRGHVTSYERRDDFATIAGANVTAFFGQPHPAWTLRVGDLVETLTDEPADRVVLDMLAPWECIDAVARVLVPGGVCCVYVATTTQLSTVVEALRAHTGFTEPDSFETMVRGWHVEGLAVRPNHRMIGHTGFLVTTRRMAPGVSAPPRRRRPAKAAGVVSEAVEPSAPGNSE